MSGVEPLNSHARCSAALPPARARALGAVLCAAYDCHVLIDAPTRRALVLLWERLHHEGRAAGARYLGDGPLGERCPWDVDEVADDLLVLYIYARDLHYCRYVVTYTCVRDV